MVAEEGGDVDAMGGEVVEVEGVEPETWDCVVSLWFGGWCLGTFLLGLGIGLGGNV